MTKTHSQGGYCEGTVIEFDHSVGDGFCYGTMVKENTAVHEITFGQTSNGAASV